jgi:RNA polymerase sigma-70 factor (ECF subfamily)
MQAENNTYAGLSDEELLVRAKAQDKEAFNRLHERYRDRILNYVYRFTGNYHRAEELTQETFMRVYNNIASVEARNAAGWIYTIARNLALNELRRLKHAPEVSLYEPLSGDGEERMLIDSLPDTSSDEKLLRQKELEMEVQRAINALPPKYREVLVLCGIQELSYEEAARALNCSVRNIGVRLHRAREMMRKTYLQRKESQ